MVPAEVAPVGSGDADRPLQRLRSRHRRADAGTTTRCLRVQVVVLEKAPGPRPQGYMIDFFGPGFGGFPDFYRKEVPKIFAEVPNPALQAQLAIAIEPAAPAMKSLANWLSGSEKQATDNFALGPARFVACQRDGTVGLPGAWDHFGGRGPL